MNRTKIFTGILIGLVIVLLVYVLYPDTETITPDIIPEIENTEEKESDEELPKLEQEKSVLGKYETDKEMVPESLTVLPKIRVAFASGIDEEPYHSTSQGYSFNGSYAGVESFNYDHNIDGLWAWFVNDEAKAQILDKKNCEALMEKDIYLPVNFQAPHLCVVSVNPQGITTVRAVGISDGYESFASLETMILVLDESRYVVFDGFLKFPNEIEVSNQFLQDSGHDKAEWASDAFVIAAKAMRTHLEERMQNPSSEILGNFRSLEEMSNSIHFISR